MATAIAATPEADPGVVARLASQKTKFKSAYKKLQAEREAEKQKVTDLEKKIADLEKSGGAAKIAELESKLKEVGHRAKFNELAKAAGVREKALNDLWEKSGYKADGDAPDETKIKAAIEAQRTERDYLFEPAGFQQPGNEGETAHGFDPFATEPLRPGPGRGQGGNKRGDGGVLGISQQQLRDPNWCFANQEALQKASAAALNLPISQVASKLTIM